MTLAYPSSHPLDPAANLPRRVPASRPEGLPRRPLRLPSLSRSARLEEGDYLPVDVGEPLDEDQVSGVVEDAQLGIRDGLGERRGVRHGNVAVQGAVDHERRGGYAPDITGEIEACACPHPLIVGR